MITTRTVPAPLPAHNRRVAHPPTVRKDFADPLPIQVDAIMRVVERGTLAVIGDGLFAGGQDAPEAPGWAVPVASLRSGYVQAVRPGWLVAQAAGRGVCLRLRPRVGEHVVAGTTLAWIWAASPSD